MVSEITIFGKAIPLYGLFFYFGIIIAVLSSFYIKKYRKFSGWEIVYSSIYTMIGAIMGSKLLFIVVSWKEIIELELTLVAVIKGGFVFFGGLIGGVVGLWIYCLIYKYNIVPYLDLFATVLPLGHAFGRIGCFFAGCCYGVPSEFGIIYKETVGMTPLGIKLLPIQLIEAICLLFLFSALVAVYSKTQIRGICAIVYCISYSVLRFILEFFRGDSERGIFLGFSTSQWICILIVFASVIIIITKQKSQYTQRRKNENGIDL